MNHSLQNGLGDVEHLKFEGFFRLVQGFRQVRVVAKPLRSILLCIGLYLGGFWVFLASFSAFFALGFLNRRRHVVGELDMFLDIAAAEGNAARLDRSQNPTLKAVAHVQARKAARVL